MTQLRTRILASFGVALLVIVTGWVGTATVSVSVATRDRLQLIRDRMDAKAKIDSEVQGARTALLAYLVTSDAAYLPRYQHFLDDRDSLTRFAQMLDDPRVQADEVRQLRSMLDAERSALTEVRRLYDSGDHTGAALLVRSGAVDLGLQRVHDQLEHITRADTESRDGLRARLSSALHAGRVVVLGGSLLAFALAVLVNLSLMRALREREDAQQLVVTQSEQLRRQTDSLLEHEQQLGEQLRAHQQLSAALRRSNEELDRFAYATSHDLKAPLRGIMNIANWVEEDLGVRSAPEVKRNLALLRSRARRLEALIEGILRYSRAGRVHDKPESVDVAALVSEIVELIAPPADCHVTGKGLPSLLTERVPLQQVLMNLIQNAVKHGCPDHRGEIEVSAEPADGKWLFRVRDHGPGIAAQFHGRIFGIFESLAPRDVVEGAGIGLSVVQRLVETRGGEVRVESELGAGASFLFTWPGEVA